MPLYDFRSRVSIVAQSAVAVSHTGNTNETTLATIVLPANSMGPNGSVRITTLWRWTNSVNNKTPRIKFGGTSYVSLNMTTSLLWHDQRIISNQGATNSQVGYSDQAGAGGAGGGFGTTTSDVVTSTVDTTAAVTILITGQLATGSETITLRRYMVELMPGG